MSNLPLNFVDSHLSKGQHKNKDWLRKQKRVLAQKSYGFGYNIPFLNLNECLVSYHTRRFTTETDYRAETAAFVPRSACKVLVRQVHCRLASSGTPNRMTVMCEQTPWWNQGTAAPNPLPGTPSRSFLPVPNAPLCPARGSSHIVLSWPHSWVCTKKKTQKNPNEPHLILVAARRGSLGCLSVAASPVLGTGSALLVAGHSW